MALTAPARCEQWAVCRGRQWKLAIDNYRMRRAATGIIGLVLFFAGGACWLWAPEGSVGWQQFHFACWRVGALMAVLWMAYPEVQRIPAWMLPLVLVALAVVAWRPRLIPVFIPLLIALAILKPRWGRRR